MVDAVVSFALNRLADFLVDEAAFLGSVKQEVQWLQNELGWMQCYIASAEEKQADDPIVRKWLNDITKIAYDAEDVIDKFVLQVHDEETKVRRQPDDQDTNKETKPTRCFPSMSSCITCNKKVNLHDIRKGIKELKIRINDLIRKRELYQLESSSNKGEGNSSNSLATLRQLRRTTSFSIVEKVVGHEDGTSRLLAKLFDLDPHRFVVSVYGMGGLGKTTLVRKLYHHLDVKRKFDCRAWVCVSQDYNTHDLLLRIISSFGFITKKKEELQCINEEDLERYLHGSLKGRSYLLVIDDIWKKEAWESIKRAFPDTTNGSRVIITTRSKEVAENSDERTYAKKLNFLYIYDEMKQSRGNSSAISMCQREAVYSVTNECLWLQHLNPNLRSVLFFDPYGYQPDIRMKIEYMYGMFRFLRVLKLHGFKKYGRNLSDEIGKLIHLKYLGLRESLVSRLPQSILNLRTLQTLDVLSPDTVVQLPWEISKLQELRHLFGYFDGHLKIESLTKLQSLKYVISECWISINTEKLGNLRELWIFGPLDEFCFDSITKLKTLEQLVVKLDHNDGFASLQPPTHCSYLMDLRLYGKIEKLPEDIHKLLPNLECLLLEDSCLEDDPMPSLEKLHNLMILCLGSRFYGGKKLFCSAQGFRRLEILKLDHEDDGGLVEWQVEEGAMPMLRGFSIPTEFESKLRIPERLKSIPPPAECEFEKEIWFRKYNL
ncbi:hypothetical protein EZV62_006850 [Acer yangbiense]|uniref:AAA+ ATPase domain-containing protein n=1 Tax=Acer yangbiense TaxID=1000413 RepID=A0A5C7I8N1_9ROSI|nr:hypothetical protein EZV62_006850 [Acer yangbiense]